MAASLRSIGSRYVYDLARGVDQRLGFPHATEQHIDSVEDLQWLLPEPTQKTIRRRIALFHKTMSALASSPMLDPSHAKQPGVILKSQKQ